MVQPFLTPSLRPRIKFLFVPLDLIRRASPLALDATQLVGIRRTTFTLTATTTCDRMQIDRCEEAITNRLDIWTMGTRHNKTTRELPSTAATTLVTGISGILDIDRFLANFIFKVASR